MTEMICYDVCIISGGTGELSVAAEVVQIEAEPETTAAVSPDYQGIGTEN